MAQLKSRPIHRLADGSRLTMVTEPDGNRRVIVQRPRYDAGLQPPAPTPKRGTIDWYVHYTSVHPKTVAGAPPETVWVDVSSSDIAYYASMLDIWERGQTFAVVEHDVVCREDCVAEFEACPEPWCCYGYSDICHWHCQEAWANMLGCTRFRRELIEAVPDAMSSIPAEGWPWLNMCDGLGRNLRAAGFSHHWHYPPAEHHHLTDGVHGPQNRWWERDPAVA